MISVSADVKNQQNVYVKIIMLEILIHVFATVTKIIKLASA